MGMTSFSSSELPSLAGDDGGGAGVALGAVVVVGLTGLGAAATGAGFCGGAGAGATGVGATKTGGGGSAAIPLTAITNDTNSVLTFIMAVL